MSTAPRLDIVPRLRIRMAQEEMALEAADEIERLRGQLALDEFTARAALRNLEGELRELASGSQDGYLLDVANRIRDALKLL